MTFVADGVTGELPPHAPHTLITELRFDVQRKYGPAEHRAFIDAFDARMRADSRVRGIAYTTSGPFSTGRARVWRSGDSPDRGESTGAVNVAGDFVDISGVHLVRGRALTRADAAATTAVVINEAFITRFDLGEPVVGQPLRMSLSREEEAAPRHVTIVAVASQPATAAIGDPMGEAPTIYLPLVIAFFVALRTNEFGIRVALGARSGDIVRMVLGQALRLAGVGFAVGAVLGVPLLIGLHANVPFTERFDPAVILPTALVLALTALFAGWVPARRASTIQASVALRTD